MKINRRSAILCLLGGLATAGVGAVVRTEKDPLSNYDRAMIAQADAIVIGTVRDNAGKWTSSRKVIYTATRIKAEEYLRGSGPVLLVEPGGTAGDVRMELHDAGIPQFTPGERVLVFLKAGTPGMVGPVDEDRPYYVMNAYYGAYRLATAKDGSVEARLVHPETGKTVRNLPLADLRTAIRSAASQPTSPRYRGGSRRDSR